jgi:putative transposase
MRYIEQNPVRAGMVASPQQYRWSSYHANAHGFDDGLVKPHPIFERMGSPGDRNAHYRALFATPLSEAEAVAFRPAVGCRGRHPKKGTGL